MLDHWTGEAYRNVSEDIPIDHGCPKQDQIIDEKTGKPIADTIREFAKNNDVWRDEFLEAYAKMITNGNTNLQSSDKQLWTHNCKCFNLQGY